MRFTRTAELIQLVHIAGPTHNMLGLQLAAEPGELEIEELAPQGPIQLEAEDVRQEACAGVREANEALGAAYTLRRIQFVPSDTGPARIYRELASAIVHHAAEGAGQDFPRAPKRASGPRITPHRRENIA